MFVISGFDHVPKDARKAVLAIGNFDGVHRGHQALLAEARKRGVPGVHQSGAIVFEPHPREFFNPDKPHFRLTTLEQKLALLEHYAMDLAVVLAFDKRLAAMSADMFIEQVLVAGLGVSHVVVGYDFYFGKDRGGDAMRLASAGRELGFGVTIVPPVAASGEVFSSSAIRADLAQGDVKGAAEELGHWWSVRGKVVGGAHRGTGMGFPTANIALTRGTALAHGIYAVQVDTGDRRVDGAAYLGTRPTFDDGAPVLEVFLFDFDDNLYGREIEVYFVDFIRGDQRFPSAEALMAQMQADCDRAREILAALRLPSGRLRDPV